MRTIVYVDGFNLYYGSLKDTPYKWLDLDALFRRILRPENEIVGIKYYTAVVKPRPGDPDLPVRQMAYIHALQAHLPHVAVVRGTFKSSVVKMMLETPIAGQRFARVHKSEEKGSDVNLAVHLLHDAWRERYDCAVVVSNDSDLAEAMRIVKTELRKKIVLAVPGDPEVRPATRELSRYANAVIGISQDAIRESQLPDPIPGTRLHKPAVW